MMTRSSVRLREIVVMGSVLRDHFDGVDRALLVAARTSRALLVVVAVAVTLAELDDSVLRAAAEAAVALDAVAAGQAARRLEVGLLGLEPLDDLGEVHAVLERQLGLEHRMDFAE